MTILTLPEALDRKALSDLSKTLLSHRGNAIVLDAAAVRKITTIGTEMLVAARHQWQADGVKFVIQNWTDEGVQALSRIGASQEMLSGGERQ